jgi:hypothetical protein
LQSWIGDQHILDVSRQIDDDGFANAKRKEACIRLTIGDNRCGGAVVARHHRGQDRIEYQSHHSRNRQGADHGGPHQQLIFLAFHLESLSVASQNYSRLVVDITVTAAGSLTIELGLRRHVRLSPHASVADYSGSNSSVTILPESSFSFEANSMERTRSNDNHNDDACDIPHFTSYAATLPSQ